MHERLIETPRFVVERRRYPHPDGGEVVRDVVVHPGAVVVLPILSEGGGSKVRVVMIRQLRPSVEETLWELPAGTREPGEAAIETARRELIEETGYCAGCMEPLGAFYTSPGITTELMHSFVATDLAPVGRRLERGEEIEVEPLRLAHVREMLSRGELRDGKTIAVLGLYFTRSG